MLRSVNAPPPSRSAVRKTDDFPYPFFSYLLSCHHRFFSTFLRLNLTVRWFRCSPTPERIRSARSVDDDDDGDSDDDGDLHSFLSTPSLFLFSSFASVILHLGSPATLYRGASIKFIRPLVAATLQDGSRRLATLCFSMLTLSSLLPLSLSLSLSPSTFSLSLSIIPYLLGPISLSLALVLLVPPSVSPALPVSFRSRCGAGGSWRM